MICARAIVTALLLVWSFARLHAQNNTTYYTDSLQQLIARSAKDANHINNFVLLYNHQYNTGNYPAALISARHALDEANAINDFIKIPRLTYNMGMVLTNLTQYDSAKYYLDECEKMLQQKPDVELLAQCFNANGTLRNYQSDYAGAIAYFIKSANLLERPENAAYQYLLPPTINNIGYILLAEKQFEKSITYEKKALAYHGYPNETRFRTLMYLNLFDASIQLKELAVSKLYLDSAIMLNKLLDNKIVASMVANNEGSYYETIKDENAALAAYTLAYRLCDTAKNEFLKAEAGANVCRMYFNKKDYATAAFYAKETNEIATRLKQFTVVASTFKLLKDIAEIKGDYKAALTYADTYKLYADSATNEATQKASLNLESKYQNQKKEKEIAELTIANTEKELTVIKRNRLLIIGGISASALLIMLSLLYRNSNQKRMLAAKEQKLQQEQIKFLQHHQQVISLQGMVNGQETERTRIAKDLHDGLGGLFSTVKMYLSTLQHQQQNLQQNELFKKSYDMVDTAANEVRRIAHSMMPEVLMKLGLENALKDLCDNISAGRLMQVSLEVNGMGKRLNPSTEIMLYRIVQELLNNIIKHAHASTAIVQFIKDGNRLSVTVEDDGRGFDTEKVSSLSHAGIDTVKSRVDYLNGHIAIESQQNVGTTVTMDFLINES